MEQDHRESLRERLTIAVPVALFMLFIMSLPTFSDKSQWRLGCVIAVGCILKAVFDHYWPNLHRYMLSNGVPSWCFEEGWRSNLLTSGVFGTLLAILAHQNNTASWLNGTPFIFKWAFICALLFLVTAIGERFKRAMGMR